MSTDYLTVTYLTEKDHCHLCTISETCKLSIHLIHLIVLYVVFVLGHESLLS